jgi:hypothetical protein
MQQQPIDDVHARAARRRRREGRRMLAGGALVGIALGVAAQAMVGTPHGELEWLVRGSLLLPALIYMASWLLVPGWSVAERDAGDASVPTQVTERIEQVESTFDSAAVPRPRSRVLGSEPSAVTRDEWRATVRVPSRSRQADKHMFGVRRPHQASSEHLDAGAG